MEIKFKKLDPRAVAPVRAHKTDAGFDLTATRITTEINECGQLILVYHTDLALEIPEGYFGALVSRSSISKKSLSLTNCIGIIDAGYRGEVMAKFRINTDVIPAVYKEGERFAQLIILPLFDIEFNESDTLSESDRNEGGFGSSDKVNDNISAPTEPAGYPEQKSELTDQEAANDGSGGEVNIPEQA